MGPCEEERCMDPLTMGVEEEYLVVDVETGELVSRSHEVLARAERRLGDEVSPELSLCQIEIGTPVCTSLDEVRQHLHRLRGEVAAAARPLGLGIAATGTHPFSPWEGQRIDRSKERYAELGDKYQVVARQQVVCGCHVHIGIDDPEVAVAVMNQVRAWLPVLLALSANSPFWRGQDTGYSSYRLQLWRSWPTAGIPPRFADRQDYDQLVHTLEAIDAIEDPTHLYWQVRPSNRYPTLEFRVLDVCLDAEHAVGLTGLIRALTWTAQRDAASGRAGRSPHTEVIEAGAWRAARYGLDGLLMSPKTCTVRPAPAVVDELLDHVAEGLAFHGDADQVTAALTGIIEDGTGASQQRRALERSGRFRDVVEEIVGRTIASTSER
jgi:glutamate---cysteine ligase / carboxylate-amine ligase